MKGHMKRCHDVTVFPVTFKDSKESCVIFTGSKQACLQMFLLFFFLFSFVVIPPLKLWALSTNDGKLQAFHHPVPTYHLLLQEVFFFLKNQTKTHFVSQGRSLPRLPFSKNLHWLAVMGTELHFLTSAECHANAYYCLELCLLSISSINNGVKITVL